MTGIGDHETILEGPDQTVEFGRRLGAECRGGERIALVGELGAGKTTFMRGFAEGLGLDPLEVSSPTFTILHVHEGGTEGIRLVHGDAYRVESLDELESIGWREYLEDQRSVVVLEWPDRIPGALGDDVVTIELMHGIPDRDGMIGRFVRCSAPGRSRQPEKKRICTACNGPVADASEHYPFCSARCRMADLGNWFSGSYSVSREIEEDDLIDPDLG